MKKTNSHFTRGSAAVKLFVPLLSIIVVGLITAAIFTAIDNRNIKSQLMEPDDAKEDNQTSENASILAKITNGSEPASERIRVIPNAQVNDGYYANISFAIYGLTKEETEKVETFDKMKVTFSDMPDFRIGIEREQFEFSDDNVIFFEVHLHRNPTVQPGPLLYGRTVHFEFKDLGIMDHMVIEGTWESDIQMADSETTSTYEADAELEGMNYYLKSVTISPISFYAELANQSDNEEIPHLDAVILEDGSRITASGDYLFTDISHKTASITEKYDHIIFTESIMTLVFSQQYLDPSQPTGFGYRYAEVSMEDIIKNQK